MKILVAIPALLGGILIGWLAAAVVPSPWSAPPETKLPETAAELPSAEVIDLILTLRKENDLLQELNQLLKEKMIAIETVVLNNALKRKLDAIELLPPRKKGS